jgi:hypothetical protein
VKRFVKAPFARTNRRCQGPSGLGRIFGGVFSARAAANGADGGGASSAGGRGPVRRGPLAALLTFAALAVILVVGVAPALADEAPTVRGLSVPSATLHEHTAKLKAEVNPKTGPSETEWEFEISSVGSTGPWTPIGGGGSLTADNTYHVVESEATGLTGNTKYWYRIVAKNEAGGNETTSSGTNNFTTNGPRTRALSVSNIAEHTALLHGEVNSAEPPEEALWHFEISSVSSSGPWMVVPGGGSLTADNTYHAVESEATGLVALTQYWYRLGAEKTGSEPSVSAASSFFTAGPPLATTSPTSGPNGAAWHVSGSVTPHNFDTHYFFEYGPDTSYGNTAPVPPGDAGSGFTAVPVGADIFGLTPGAEYHFRLVAENAGGTAYGEDQTFVVALPPEEGAASCPNDPRVGPSIYLPDCRAYEMVSPPDKEGLQVLGLDGLEIVGPLGAQDGTSATFNTQGAFGEPAANGLVSTYFSQRSGSGWSSKYISPPLEPYGFIIASLFYGFTPSLEEGVIFGGWNPPLTPDASPGTSNLYVENTSSGSFRLVSVGAPADAEEIFWSVGGVSDDGSHVVFSTPDKLAGDCGPPAIADYFCAWSAATGELSLIGRAPGTNAVLTGGTVQIASPSGFFSQGQAWRRPISADGSRLFFRGGGSGCGVCVRINGATTQVVTATGSFQVASSNGSLAFVTDPPANGDLERYNVATDELTPLTSGGEVQGVLGSAADGSRVYFVAKGVLAPGATAGQNNLYMWSEGEGIDFIATGNTNSIFTSNYATGGPGNSRVTPDGMHLAFTANNSLTGYPDNNKSEVYLYSAASGELVCASCNPSGEPATSGGFMEGTPNELGYQSRNLSNDGAHLFFSTEESVAPRDTNTQEDVYEYDSASGEVALISTGTSAYPSVFGDASASGNDAFIVTNQQLVGIDKDEVADLYDARVGGGLASQNPPGQVAPCTGKECRGETSTPSLAGATSATVVGKGNLSSKQNCNKLGKEAKKLSKRAKRLRKNANKAKKAGKSSRAKKLNKKSNRLAKQARNKSKSAKKCRKRNRGASK